MAETWTEPRHGEVQARRNGRVLHINVGSPNLFCYSNGEYLGTKKTMQEARQLCASGKREAYVAEFETVDEALEQVPKNKRPKLTWNAAGRDEWHATVDGEKLPARIRSLDERTHAVYRDGRYLGCEDSLENAKKRAIVNTLSQRNRVQRLWEQIHPGELPPFVSLTPEERAEFWRRNPGRAVLAPRVTSRGAAPRPDEDPATAALRASLAAEGGAGRQGRAKAAGRAIDASTVPDGTIKVRAGAVVPKKPGSDAHKRWTLLWEHDGKEVSDFLSAKGNPTTLANAMSKGFVTVEK